MVVAAQLVEAAQRGDSDALDSLLVRCAPDVRRYARHYCATTADAEDAAQETLIRAWRHLPSLRSAAVLGRWLMTTLKRECDRLARKMFHRDVPFDEAVESRYLATRADIDLRLDIARAIQSLPDLYREVIVLRDFEELTVGEIAQRIGALPETVKTRISRGRKLIREHLLS